MVLLYALNPLEKTLKSRDWTNIRALFGIFAELPFAEY